MATTILELFENRVNSSGVKPALRRKRDGQWQQQSWKDWWDTSERIAAGLIELGVRPGDRVGIMAQTRMEWVWVDMAILMAGAVVVPLYPENLPSQCNAILEQCAVRFVFAEGPAQIDKLLTTSYGKKLTRVVYFDRHSILDSPDLRGRKVVSFEDVEHLASPNQLGSLEEVIALGRRKLVEKGDLVARRRRALQPQDIASIVYPSSTTEVPRGVMLTHANFAAEVDALKRLGMLSDDDLQLLFLPLAHVFTKGIYLVSIAHGLETAFAQSSALIFDNLEEVKPTVIAGVPRLFEKLHSRLLYDATNSPLQARLFEMAMGIGQTARRYERLGNHVGRLLRLEHDIASRLVFQKVHDALGGNLRLMLSGGASLNPRLAEFFYTAGLLIVEGYGLTETTGALSFNMPDAFKFGTVGQPVYGVDVTIAEDGEILIRGATVFQGYYGNQEASSAVFDADGWFHTGDIGEFDGEGFLTITGRKKDVIVISTGQVILPNVIEELLRQCPFISQAVIYGDDRPYLIALITLESSVVERWAKEHRIVFDDELSATTAIMEVEELIQQWIDELNRRLAPHETIRKFAILDDDFSPSRDEISLSGKLIRQRIYNRYRRLFASLYRDSRLAI